MEWVLQVVDEIDDAIAAARHRWFGFQAALAAVAVATVGVRRSSLPALERS